MNKNELAKRVRRRRAGSGEGEFSEANRGAETVPIRLSAEEGLAQEAQERLSDYSFDRETKEFYFSPKKFAL